MAEISEGRGGVGVADRSLLAQEWLWGQIYPFDNLDRNTLT